MSKRRGACERARNAGMTKSVLLHIGTPTSPEDGAQAQGRDEGVRVQGRNASESACTCALCCTADGRAPRKAGGDGRTGGSARESVRRWHGWGALQYTGMPASRGRSANTPIGVRALVAHGLWG
eukprot:3308625-Prymnesium_polylepis.1